MKLNEALPALIPEFPIQIAGQHLTLRFDVNVNKTKKGVKLQFVMNNLPSDPRQAQEIASQIGTELQQKFGNQNLQIIYDTENPYKNVVGFLLPLPSLANFLIAKVLKGDGEEQPTGEEQPQQQQQRAAPAPKPEQPSQELPAQETPPGGDEEPLKEWFKKIAGIK